MSGATQMQSGLHAGEMSPLVSQPQELLRYMTEEAGSRYQGGLNFTEYVTQGADKAPRLEVFDGLVRAGMHPDVVGDLHEVEREDPSMDAIVGGQYFSTLGRAMLNFGELHPSSAHQAVDIVVESERKLWLESESIDRATLRIALGGFIVAFNEARRTKGNPTRLDLATRGRHEMKKSKKLIYN